MNPVVLHDSFYPPSQRHSQAGLSKITEGVQLRFGCRSQSPNLSLCHLTLVVEMTRGIGSPRSHHLHTRCLFLVGDGEGRASEKARNVARTGTDAGDGGCSGYLWPHRRLSSGPDPLHTPTLLGVFNRRAQHCWGKGYRMLLWRISNSYLLRHLLRPSHLVLGLTETEIEGTWMRKRIRKESSNRVRLNSLRMLGQDRLHLPK
jgi:hypothetical protein